jgi:hypothetical protein
MFFWESIKALSWCYRFFYLLLKWTVAIPMTPRTMSPFSPVAFGIIALSKGLVGGEHVLMINSLYASFVVDSSSALPSEKHGQAETNPF